MTSPFRVALTFDAEHPDRPHRIGVTSRILSTLATPTSGRRSSSRAAGPRRTASWRGTSRSPGTSSATTPSTMPACALSPAGLVADVRAAERAVVGTPASTRGRGSAVRSGPGPTIRRPRGWIGSATARPAGTSTWSTGGAAGRGGRWCARRWRRPWRTATVRSSCSTPGPRRSATDCPRSSPGCAMPAPRSSASTSWPATACARRLRTVLAVDGGNSKTDVALVSEDGRLLAAVRGGSVSIRPSASRRGWSGWRCSWRLSGPGRAGPAADGRADVAAYARRRRRHAMRRPGRTRVAGVRADRGLRNDAFEVLRSGTDRGWGVAIIGGGGRRPRRRTDGRTARLDALGAFSGDWGGGTDVGWAAVAAVVRDRDGRGPGTSLARIVPAHFGLRSPGGPHRGPVRRTDPVGARARAHRSPSRRPSMVTLSRAGSSTASPTRSSRWPRR